MYGKIRTKTPGLKAECLRKAFDAVFEGNRCIPKNSIGIYTPDEIYRCKRAVCFSSTPLVFSKFAVFSSFKPSLDTLGTLARKTLVWGVCGQTPTRANELEEKKFLLCYKKEKKFIAAAIVDTEKTSAEGDSLRVTGMSGNERSINQVLDMMKAERFDFNQKRLMHLAMKRERLSSGKLQSKYRKSSEDDVIPSLNSSSDETDSDVYHSEEDEDEDVVDSPIVSSSPTGVAASSPEIENDVPKITTGGDYEDAMCDTMLWMDQQQPAGQEAATTTCDLHKMYYDVLGHEDVCQQLKSPVIYFTSAEEEQEYTDSPFLQSFYEMVASAKHANVPLF